MSQIGLNVRSLRFTMVMEETLVLIFWEITFIN